MRSFRVVFRHSYLRYPILSIISSMMICRLQLLNGEFQGVDLLCTRNRSDTVKFFIHQLDTFQKQFDPRRLPEKTMEQLKLHIKKQMKAPTFLEYLRLRSMPGIGDVRAMSVSWYPV